VNLIPENPEAVPGQAQDPAPATPATLPIEPAPPADPAWSGWDLLGLVAVTVVTLVACSVAALFAAKFVFYPHAALTELARNALVVVAGQGVGYLFVLGYMYVLVTRQRRHPDFLAAIHWNWPARPGLYLAGGVVLSIALQLLAHLLPIPKNLPIDTFFSTSVQAWVLAIFGITLAPLMEELLFRGFLYPTLERYTGFSVAVPVTALAFALVHASQLKSAWGPLLVIFMVGLALTIVRAKKDSVAASFLMHASYNATLSVLLFAATDGFRHMEKIRGQ